MRVNDRLWQNTENTNVKPPEQLPSWLARTRTRAVDAPLRRALQQTGNFPSHPHSRVPSLNLSPWRWAQLVCVSCCSAYTAAHSSRGRHSWHSHTSNAIWSTSLNNPLQQWKEKTRKSKYTAPTKYPLMWYAVTIRCSEKASQGEHHLTTTEHEKCYTCWRDPGTKSWQQHVKGQLPLQVSVMSGDWTGSHQRRPCKVDLRLRVNTASANQSCKRNASTGSTTSKHAAREKHKISHPKQSVEELGQQITLFDKWKA